MINYDNLTKEKINKHNLNWPRIPQDLYRILIIGDSRSGNTYALLNLINQQKKDDYNIIDKIYSYVKDPFETKYQYLIKKPENNGLTNLKDLNAFIEYSNNMQDV